MSEKHEVFDKLEYFLTPEILPLFSRDKWLVPPTPDIPEGNVREILRSLQVWKSQPLNLALTPIRNPVTGHVLNFKEAEADSVSDLQIELLSRERNVEKSEESDNKEKNINIISDSLLTIPPGLNEGISYPNGDFRFNDFPTLGENELPKSSASVLERLKLKLPDHMKSEVTDKSESGSEFDSDDESIQEDDIQVEHYRNKPLEGKQEEAILIASRQQPSTLPKAKSWAYPVDVKNTPVADFHTIVSRPARNWPFELDTFQKQAVIYLEQHRDVFVSAHTSAGKTVVAEYAIALSKRHNKRTIYTSPIKALSNQKFREFKHHFEDVGLITGDIQINPTGTCLIMTTEILRSMLYNRSAIIWELDWVIFDECHYINDADRGVVWEEVIIMLPPRISIILLSATIANPLDFAEWVGRIKERKIYVISTSHRPVPLEHYLFTGNSNRTSSFLFKIVDEHRSFSMPAYTRAVDSTKPQPSGPCASAGKAQALAAAGMGSGDRGRGADRGKGRGGRGHHHHKQHQVKIPTSGSGAGWEGAEKTFWFAVIQMLKADERLPAVVFVFSKARIDQISLLLHNADLLTKSEQNTVHCFIQSCLKRLKPQDRRIPQLRNMQELLVRGIGIHHSGILPFLREVVELLFQKSLVKVLFATETFAMGVNMPARTVLFDSIRKFDGKGRRLLLPGEYTQMAGRAGRRGLDSVGSVIVLCRNGEVPQMGDLQKMLLGKPTPLESHFRLTYAMILSLLRHEASRVFDMMRRSFGEFSDQVSLERRKLRRQELTETLRLWSGGDCQHCVVDLEKYVRLGLELVRLRETTWTDICKLPNFSKLLCCGRLVIFMKCRPGIVLQSSNKSVKVFSFSPLPTPVRLGSDGNLIANELLLPSGFQLVNPADDEEFIPTITEVSFDKIDSLCEAVIRLDNRSVQEINEDISKRRMARLKCDPYAKATKATLKELHRQLLVNDSNLAYWTGVSSDIVTNEALKVELKQLQDIEAQLSSNRFVCMQCPDLKSHFKDIEEKVRFVDELEDLKRDLDGTYNRLQLLPEYQQRVEVLRELGFVDPHGHIRLKGRMACAISSHELVITELVLTGQLEKIEASELAALFSAFIFEHRRLHDDESGDPRNKSLPSSLKEAQKTLVSVAERVGQVQKQCGMKEPVEDFVNRLNFDLTAVVLEWARGMPFKDIAESTEVQEGIIVRTVVRLDELLRNVGDAAHVLGNPVLQEKMKEASQKIKRDIIFAASLYTD